ncbi:hypothetical protein [Wolbachia endosymbiont of Cantharis cryptica]|uniref:hypothetical protein n=1 Tax=Wolbachia endosymbiont of Cantharis cryptica TaxID=3066132 RepID=UPI00376ECAE7
MVVKGSNFSEIVRVRVPESVGFHDSTLGQSPAGIVRVAKEVNRSSTLAAMLGKETPKWWEDKNNFSHIVKAADYLLRYSPNSDIYSLGKGPVLILEASRLIAKDRNEKRQFGHIPFSGSFMENINGRFEHPAYRCSEDRPFPSEKELTSYRKLLEDRKLSPGKIFSRYDEEGQKTAILTHTNTGRSIASFVWVLFGWAKEQGIKLDDALEIVALERIGSLPSVKHINIPQAEIYVKCRNDIYVKNDLLVALDGVNDSDGIVPKYPHRFWCSPPQPVGNEEHITMLKENLEGAVQKYLAREKVVQPSETLKSTSIQKAQVSTALGTP